MSLDQEFSSCVRVVERLFSTIHQDIFEISNTQPSTIGFVAFALLFVSTMSMLGYTVANFDRDIAAIAIAALFGTFQVCHVCI